MCLKYKCFKTFFFNLFSYFEKKGISKKKVDKEQNISIYENAEYLFYTVMINQSKQHFLYFTDKKL